jgi:aspartate dehydrogenase
MCNLKVILVGWGAIGARVAGLLAERDAPVTICAVGLRDAGTPRAGLSPAIPILTQPEGLAALAPDLVVEAAGRSAVLPWGLAALASEADFAPASMSAFADGAALDELLALARRHGSQVLVPPGALGGIDALAAAARLPLTSVIHEITKPPAAWAGTPAERLCPLSHLTAPHCFFEGSAQVAARDFPQNANVAVTTALAGLGPEHTTIRLIADPDAQLNRHRVVAEGAFGRLDITLDNQPLAGNPKSSELTALSLVRLIENRAAPLVI